MTISGAEARALIADREADEAWIEWCRSAVSRGVRCDVSPMRLATLPRWVEVAPGVHVTREGES